MGIKYNFSMINEWEDALILELPSDLDSEGRKIKRNIMKRVRNSRIILKILNYILK